MRSYASHVATASSTLIGMLGLAAAAAKYSSVQNFLEGLGAAGQAVLGVAAGVIAIGAAAFVERALKKKE